MADPRAAVPDTRGEMEAPFRVGARIRRARQQAGMTVQEVAAAAGLLLDEVIGIENGDLADIGIKTGMRVANAVGARWIDLAGDLGDAIELSPAMVDILATLRAAPLDQQEFLPSDLQERSGVPVREFYSGLEALEEVGYVRGRWEGQSVGAERPPRTCLLYRLTVAGDRLAGLVASYEGDPSHHDSSRLSS